MSLSLSQKFIATKPREVSLNGNLKDFSVNYNSVDKFDILNIHIFWIRVIMNNT